VPIGSDLQQDLSKILTAGLGGAARLGLAVSGGGDSMAMLHLAHRAGLRPHVATVDHGLRAASGDEARMVAQICAELGFPHVTLHWRTWDQRGNLQQAASRARRALLADWARAQGLSSVAFAHTRDDLAETFLMRLARGAGVDGLAAMRTHWHEHGIQFLRPLLAASRDDLRAFLRSINAKWIDDPSNELDRFDRVRVRKALKLLIPLGIDAPRIAEVAAHMSQARRALEVGTDALITGNIMGRAGILCIKPQIFDAPVDLQRRLLQRVITWVHPQDYGPRGPALVSLRDRLFAGVGGQLAGCHFIVQGGSILAFREAKTLQRHSADLVWDGVWQAVSPSNTMQIGPLGAKGLRQWPMWRDLGIPRAALLSQPSLWQGETLISTALQTTTDAQQVFFRATQGNCLDDLNLSH
jgi:tRNA(Ile)-lysidine synthase